MWRIRILHGPNVRYIGQGREPTIYGNLSWEAVWQGLCERYGHLAHLTYLESPHEGQLVEWIWETTAYDGLIFNPGALAHTSYVLYDALRGCKKPCIEVHVSSVYRRESFRQRLLTARACVGVIAGVGMYGYELALLALLHAVLPNYDSTASACG
ncbi:MAG: 3-dehydroquinate dehydratase [Bacteroidia bacterium]|nr:3-dehydroquinate dehydratase [Bacteroidia bacterium]MDW8088404.1 type II 3-dehydroquinate dehydratase [Bacteroidia bacterium]